MPARVQQLVLGLGKAKQTEHRHRLGARSCASRSSTPTSPRPSRCSKTTRPRSARGTSSSPRRSPRITRSPTASRSTPARSSSPGPRLGLGNVGADRFGAPVHVHHRADRSGHHARAAVLLAGASRWPRAAASAIDNLYIGCAIEDFTYQFNYGPGRASSKMTVNWVGSGLLTTPSRRSRSRRSPPRTTCWRHRCRSPSTAWITSRPSASSPAASAGRTTCC